MTPLEDFTAAATHVPGSKFIRTDAAVLAVTVRAHLDIVHFYDFFTRTVLTRVENKDHNHLIHFRDADPETLAFMHAKLIELGGKPPALPAYVDNSRAPRMIAKATVPEGNTP